MLNRALLSRAAPATLAAATCATVAMGVWRSVRLRGSMKIADDLAERAVPFERQGKPDCATVLVVGDSTAVGTGAARPEESIAGRLASAFPDAAVVNRARNGAKTLDAIMQLADQGGARYDLVLIHVGANDVIRRTPLRALVPQVRALMRCARRVSDNVIVTSIPNVGVLPLFFPPLSWWLSRRSRHLCTLLEQAAMAHGVHYVDFFRSRTTEFFRRDASHYFAGDRLHPSAACYLYVYEGIVKSTPIASFLERTRDGGDAAEIHAA